MNKLLLVFILLLGMENSIFSQVDIVYSKLVWSDEFDGNGAIESSRWHHQTLLPNGNSWYNGEVQHYTDLTSNSFVNGGLLNIVAKKENYTNQGVTKNYTSARLNSKFAFTYGRVDVRAKMPLGAGVWPAIWLLGKNIKEPGGYFSSQYGTTNWPACGEIDMIECGIFPSEPSNYFASAIHTTSSSGSTVNKGGRLANNLGADFHVYSMNWSPNQITFLLDNVPYYTYKPTTKNQSTWPFDSPQYILLNIAMGGVAGAIPSAFSQATMQIDYLRIYQKEDSIPKDTIAKDTIKRDTLPPQNFTARAGNINSSAIELLVSATAFSDTMLYSIKYGNTTLIEKGLSGLEKSIKLYNLIPNTNYSFDITVKDVKNNLTVAKTVNASTLEKANCLGQSVSAQQGDFTKGYLYSFDPFGNELIVQYELLDTDRTGVVGFLLSKSPFSESAANFKSGNKFTYIVNGFSNGFVGEFAVKFSYAGGNTISSYYSYNFNEKCTAGVEHAMIDKTFTYQNPASNTLTYQSVAPIEELSIHNSLGQEVLNMSYAKAPIDISHLLAGIYHLSVRINGKRQYHKLIINN